MQTKIRVVVTDCAPKYDDRRGETGTVVKIYSPRERGSMWANRWGRFVDVALDSGGVWEFFEAELTAITEE